MGDIAHHILEAHQAHFHATKTPNAIVFFDLRAAFCTVLRQSLMDLPQNLEASTHALAPMMAILGASPHLQHLVRDAMTSTHFQVSYVPDVCCTTRGTRPGDPLGDLLFNMITRLVLIDYRDIMLATADCVWMGSPESTPSFANAPELPAAGVLDLAFVDDAAIAVLLSR